MTNEVILFIGLQASGKSSFYRDRFAETHDLVSKDRFANNRNPARRQRQLIQESLGAGRSVVIDNTNPTVEARAESIAIARAFGAQVAGYYFESILADCLNRNRRREGKARVPDVALYAARKRLQLPSLAEGFDRLYYVRLAAEERFEVQDFLEERRIMKPDEIESRMRALEVFHSIRFLPGAWVILRLDGRGFSRFTESRFEKPFDGKFHDGMVQTAHAVLEDLQGVYAYTESDEISVLFPRTWDLFDRELEKAVSLSASIASAALTFAFGERVHFDSRAVLAAEEEQVVDYFRWRQADAARCALNGWTYWTLRKAGQGVAEATTALEGKSVGDKNELLFQAGINFNDVPLWQRRGTGLYWEQYEREGRNPKLDQKVVTTRRRIKADQELPMSEEYAAFIRRRMRTGTAAPTATTGDPQERGDT